MAEQKQRKHNFEVNAVMDRIIDQNPQLIPSRIELFTEVFYPIAIIELDMTETVFEDFEIVPLSVLKFIDAGVDTAEGLAGLMGLSNGYAQKVMDLLMGFGYVTSFGVTALGKEALKAEKKISHTAVRQRFQADAITGDLLKIGDQQSEADLVNAKQTFGVIPHIPHIEGVSTEAIDRQLRKDDLTKYKRYQGDVLNANVETIRGAECVDLEYVKAYLIKLQGIDCPMIFTYKNNSTKTKFNERYRWQPIRVPSEKAYAEYGFSRELELYSDEARGAIKELYQLVCKNVIDPDVEKFKKKLEHIHPFKYSTMDISMGRIAAGAPDQIRIYLNADSFTKWNAFVLLFLEKYDSVTGFLYTNSWLNGLFIRFESQNREIMMASKKYKRMLRRYERRQTNTFIRKSLFEKQEDSFAWDDFFSTLEKFEKEMEAPDESDSG